MNFLSGLLTLNEYAFWHIISAQPHYSPNSAPRDCLASHFSGASTSFTKSCWNGELVFYALISAIQDDMDMVVKVGGLEGVS